MADLQQSVVSDPETKQQIYGQIIEWEENLERLHCEQFRLRCYMASLHNGELPNPKVRRHNNRFTTIYTYYRYFEILMVVVVIIIIILYLTSS